MKKVVGLCVINAIINSVICFFIICTYKQINIFNLYFLLFFPSGLMAAVYAMALKTKKIILCDMKMIYTISAFFAITGSLGFGVINMVLQKNNEIFTVILNNSRKVLSSDYLVLKNANNVTDYIMIFAFIFVVFYLVGRGMGKVDEENKNKQIY